MTTTVLETCSIPPPAGAAAELTVPLSFFDIPWLQQHHPVRRILFYDYPCSKPHFLDTIVPQLKQSLSLTLQHYLPLAGNLLYPSHTDKNPVFRYVTGDSVSLTFAESGNDFDELTGNHARDADQFYDFVPQMPPVTEESEYKIVPLIALKVTLFPDRGISISYSYRHVIGDGNSIASFVLAWASINKSHGDSGFLSESLPVFDRSVIQDTNGTDTLYWKAFRNVPFNPSSSSPVPTNRVRATFILTQTDINNLKNKVSAKKLNVSSFVVTVSYVWTCLLKSEGEEEVVKQKNQSELILIPADGRGRLNARINPPVPANYFGNCLGGAMTVIEHEKLVGEEGFVNAAVAIAEDIKKKVYNKDEFLKDVEKLPSVLKSTGVMMRAFGVSGSPKFDMYVADYGWGKARKQELVSLDEEKHPISVCKSRDTDGGLEIGLSLTKQRMEAFADVFVHGLNS